MDLNAQLLETSGDQVEQFAVFAHFSECFGMGKMKGIISTGNQTIKKHKLLGSPFTLFLDVTLYTLT